ncbi:M56 family metallopeptidase [Chlorogloea sp. CCALA 695]|uniref:M56 family metallopeptidase n=1 Tax=Chlorogloea sp. CCALA 695 TaxID=2107693 RepID=UPI000D056314|nr:M56 family metallopeptidase [Chlorogloea sp. CCALA 695]PSB33359.1 Zn-dependent protease with chaperone function [Chlorogloea sp. CCALA 695]
MHLIMILTALGVAGLWRYKYPFYSQGSWNQRWHQVLSLFALPPLLLTMTGVAVLYMGADEEPMLWQWQGRFSYLIVSGMLGFAAISLLKLAYQSWQTQQIVRTCPQITLLGKRSRVVANPLPFSALVGFWQPELIVTEGLLTTLDNEHLEAVLHHEQGHYYYRDTFWFFWLGWARSYTAWLPHTEQLWQELLLLREIRADFWAAQQVDPLLLAESLLQVVSTVSVPPDSCCAAFSCAAVRDRTSIRIDALLAPESVASATNLWFWSWLVLAFLPLVAVPFHTCSHLTSTAH